MNVLDFAWHYSFYSSNINNSCNVWYLRLGHISDIGLQTFSKLFPFISCKNDNLPCDSCHFAKQNNLPFPHKITDSSAPFDILHVDMWGPFSAMPALGHEYFLTLVDDYTRYTWVVFLKNKDQTKSSIIQFLAYIENQFKKPLKCLRIDNGT